MRIERISRWSVGMHVHHCALSVSAIVTELERSVPPPPFAWRSWIGRIVVWRGRLPRGRAQAPEQVQPSVEASPEQLLELLDAAARDIERARGLSADRWFGHFALGVLPRDRALRFVEVHTLHHARIVEELLAAQ
ncbi:MAG: DUF1569 domain-containing protein [Planctomycetes bacterium]|nr:DUF1569 domain-containing protein [Planctomycetota bacterium]